MPGIQLPSTTATPLQQQIANYFNAINAAFTQLQAVYAQGDALLWNNPLGYAPSTVAAGLDIYGTGAVQWQNILASTISTVTGAPPATTYAGQSVTLLSTGAISVTASTILSTLGTSTFHPA